ncbi:hypothetical protein COJ27_09555 [Bacillus cereus]|uniref:putative phage abortive infection protein n=1 Tax=Bacillus cereus TaxID=1396 RepID=UPI000BF6BB39|nr:putative phage abortive infection protein [Bacillus cereus]PFL65071.1 hypothetical protein COJ27_09555 [Bacillus cereus]
MANKDKDEKENTERWAKFLTWIGFALVPIAVAMPFIVYNFDFSYLTKLGAVGDFIGGTTVTFLTGASVFLLIATNIMQRKELQISRQSIDQLVEQTAASVQQAKEAKVETQITNETMKRQQFETTFFNMINLHQNILDRLRRGNDKGHEVIESCLESLKSNYDFVATEQFKKMYETNNYEAIVDLYEYLKKKKVSGFEWVPLNDKELVLEAFGELNFNDIFKFVEEKEIIWDFMQLVRIKHYDDLIYEAYSRMRFNYDSCLGGYFNAINVIIKFLHENQGEMENKNENYQDNKIYREIFFSQLSSSEMMLLYYHVKYSREHEWLLNELKVCNLFYPSLMRKRHMFGDIDKKNIEELSK